MMFQQTSSPLDILCRELHRLDNDLDRLQMLVTLKSHFARLLFTSTHIHSFLSSFHTEYYRLQAIQHLLVHVTIIDSDFMYIEQ
jgi:hypothetical protein